MNRRVHLRNHCGVFNSTTLYKNAITRRTEGYVIAFADQITFFPAPLLFGLLFFTLPLCIIASYKNAEPSSHKKCSIEVNGLPNASFRVAEIKFLSAFAYDYESDVIKNALYVYDYEKKLLYCFYALYAPKSIC